MKVSNLKITRIIAYSQLVSALLMLIIIFFIHKIIIDVSLMFLCGFLIYSFVKIKTISFEYSGGCITVRRAHPFSYKKFISPEFELPCTSVRNTIITTGICITKLKLNIRSNREQRYALKFNFLGLSNGQKKELKRSIERMKSKI